MTFKYSSMPNTAPLTVETLPYIMIGYSLFVCGVLYMLNRIAAGYAASKSWDQAIADAMSTTGKASHVYCHEHTGGIYLCSWTFYAAAFYARCP